MQHHSYIVSNLVVNNDPTKVLRNVTESMRKSTTEIDDFIHIVRKPSFNGNKTVCSSSSISTRKALKHEKSP